MIKILFVCLGNICRSPAAEGVFRALVEKESLSNKIFIDSAGTSAYHTGESADNRMIKHASKRFINLTSKSRQLMYEDLELFDYIVVMDSQNYKDVLSIDTDCKYRSKVKLMTDFSVNYFGEDVPDPYYGGSDGFEKVLDILEESCQKLLEFLS